jgi:hypothetical protein
MVWKPRRGENRAASSPIPSRSAEVLVVEEDAALRTLSTSSFSEVFIVFGVRYSSTDFRRFDVVTFAAESRLVYREKMSYLSVGTAGSVSTPDQGPAKYRIDSNTYRI